MKWLKDLVRRLSPKPEQYSCELEEMKAAIRLRRSLCKGRCQ